jgi:hypothetical protein
MAGAKLIGLRSPRHGNSRIPVRPNITAVIYVGVINWLLMIVTVCLTLFFGKVGQSGRRLRHRCFRDYAYDLGALVHRHA